MDCNYCGNFCTKAGKQANGEQRYYCKGCKKYQQKSYIKNAYKVGINSRIIAYTTESCGIRSISRLLKISTSTVMKRIKSIAKNLSCPNTIAKGKDYEMDESAPRTQDINSFVVLYKR